MIQDLEKILARILTAEAKTAEERRLLGEAYKAVNSAIATLIKYENKRASK